MLWSSLCSQIKSSSHAMLFIDNSLLDNNDFPREHTERNLGVANDSNFLCNQSVPLCDLLHPCKAIEVTGFHSSPMDEVSRTYVCMARSNALQKPAGSSHLCLVVSGTLAPPC